jgi:hypothetical protein
MTTFKRVKMAAEKLNNYMLTDENVRKQQANIFFNFDLT